jgi:hypothetical protein
VKSVAGLFTARVVSGTAWVVTRAAPLTERKKVFDEVWGAGVVLSDTVTVKVVDEIAVVGVPVI